MSNDRKEEEYNSEEDSDFEPEEGSEEEQEESGAEEEETEETKTKKPKTKEETPTTTTTTSPQLQQQPLESVSEIWEKLKAKTQTSSTNSTNSTTQNSNPPSTTEQSKKTVTTVYNFAGENVVVTKEEKTTTTNPNALKRSIPTTNANQGSVGRGRGSVLNSILGPKPKKMSTLDKSKLDWGKYRTELKIEDDLDRSHKSGSGYLDHQAFLNRADQRQYEQERATRLSRK